MTELADNHRIVTIAEKFNLSAAVKLNDVLKPTVDYTMSIDVGEDRTCHVTLRAAFLAHLEFTVAQDTCLEHPHYVPDEGFVFDAEAKHLHKLVVIDRSKVILQIDIDYSAALMLVQEGAKCLDRRMAAPLWPEAIGAIAKGRFVNRTEYLGGHSLYHLILEIADR